MSFPDLLNSRSFLHQSPNWLRQTGCSVFVLAMLVGCGGSPAPQSSDQSAVTADEAAADSSDSAPFVPPVASIRQPSDEELSKPIQTVEVESPSSVDTETPETTTASAMPEKGTAEWLIREITRLRTAPTNMVRQPVAGDPEKFETVELSAQEAQQEKIRRQYEIIDLATQAIGKTYNDKEQQQFFNNAVHYLADARMQLALNGDDEQAELLKDDADTLFQRDPTSFAAVESAFKVVQLVQSQAQRNAATDSKWALAFARQARLFSNNFPQETSRAAVNLLAAGRMCDNMGLHEEAKTCLLVIEQKFGQTPFAEQAASSLRRLQLPGQPLAEFGGSTHDGGFVSIEQYRGKTLFIAFWASNSARFRSDLPIIQQALKKYEGKVTALGVNLDRDERAVDRFLEETDIGWKHIFYSDREKRGAKNVVARYYGVTAVPTYWLIDPAGVVQSINLDVAQLDQAIARTLTSGQTPE